MKIVNVFLLGLLLLSSCSKESDTKVPQPPYVSVINTSPTLGTYLVYLNGTKMVSSGLAFGGVIPYRVTTAGNAVFKFTTESSSESVLNKTFPLSTDNAYSVFLVDKDTQMDAIMVTDNVGTVSKEKAFIRFINLSPDAPAFNLTLAAGDVLATAKGYKGSSEFIPMDPKAYTFNIKNSSTGEVKAELTNQTLYVGRYYTVIARGLVNVTSDIQQPLSAQLMIHQ